MRGGARPHLRCIEGGGLGTKAACRALFALVSAPQQVPLALEHGVGDAGVAGQRAGARE
jgi:hypothetical protein